MYVVAINKQGGAESNQGNRDKQVLQSMILKFNFFWPPTLQEKAIHNEYIMLLMKARVRIRNSKSIALRCI